jgi:hypothetical protein
MSKLSITCLSLLLLVLILPVTNAIACEQDEDCGVGVCIKREKRAQGICYGLEPNQKQKNKLKSPREKAIGLMGDPNKMLKEHFPGKKIGKICIVSTDCDDGQDCVHAGFEGRCMEL